MLRPLHYITLGQVDVLPNKEDGITNQRMTIHYNNCIGAFEVPDRRNLPERDILLETGKGVTLSYAPAQIAI